MMYLSMHARAMAMNARDCNVRISTNFKLFESPAELSIATFADRFEVLCKTLPGRGPIPSETLSGPESAAETWSPGRR